MILPVGLAIRFKGDNSDRYATEFCDVLRGHCSRNGSKLVITKSARLKVKLCDNGETERITDLSAMRSNHE